MKKIIIGIIAYLFLFVTSVNAQVVTVEANFTLDIDIRKINDVLLLIKDSAGVEHVVEMGLENNFKANVIIADGEYTILSYLIAKDYSKNYPIIVTINRDVYPNIINMKVTKKNSALTTTTTTNVQDDTSTTTLVTTTTTSQVEKKKKSSKIDAYTIVIIAIPIIAFIGFVLYGVYKYIKTIR